MVRQTFCGAGAASAACARPGNAASRLPNVAVCPAPSTTLRREIILVIVRSPQAIAFTRMSASIGKIVVNLPDSLAISEKTLPDLRS